MITKVNYKLSPLDGKPKQILIAIHGFAGDANSSTIQELADKLRKDNVLVVSFDLPCHGDDKNTMPLDLDLCYKYLDMVVSGVKKEYDLPISFFATSFGGYLLLNYLKNTKYNFANAKIILRAPAVYMDEILVQKILPEHNYQLKDLQNGVVDLGYEKPLLVANKFLTQLEKDKITTINTNYFYNIIQGKKDNIVDYKQNQKLFRRYPKNYKFYYFPKADHRFKNEGELTKIVEIVENILVSK